MHNNKEILKKFYKNSEEVGMAQKVQKQERDVRDMVQHPCLYDSCTANASLFVSVFLCHPYIFTIFCRKFVSILVSILFMEH